MNIFMLCYSFSLLSDKKINKIKASDPGCIMVSIFRGMFVICKEWPAVLAAGLVAEPFTPG